MMSKKAVKDTYRYQECGLDNIILVNVNVTKDDKDNDTITIPNIRQLHRAIATSILKANGKMSSKELRFLRTELGLTRAELSKYLHCDQQTIGRWERGETDMDGGAEAFFRIFVADIMQINIELQAKEIGLLCEPNIKKPPIRIDASNPENYRPAA